MADPKRTLQASFEPPKRHAHYGEALVQVRIVGIRNHKDTILKIESPVSAFCGVNGSGKSTVIQLAAAAYQVLASQPRYYISSFIQSSCLDRKPFDQTSFVEYTYVDAPTTSGTFPTRKLTVSRSGTSWTGYDRLPTRRVLYLGTGFYQHHADRDDEFKKLFESANLRSVFRSELDAMTTEWVSKILLCKYDTAHHHTLKKERARKSNSMTSAKRDGDVEYSEANMGTGEARLYAMVTKLETMTPKSLVLLEEPETALHPSAQFELGKYLVNVAERRQLQIMLTTHSEYLMLALPQMSRVYLKRDATGITPLPGVGVRQAMSMMDGLAVPSMYILVEDDVAEAVITELLRMCDADFAKTARVLVGGDTRQIQQMMKVFEEQKMPICAVRDGDKPGDNKLHLYKLFGKEPPEKEIFKSQTVRKCLFEDHGVDMGMVDVVNRDKPNHHDWFGVLVQQMARNRSDVLSIVAQAYLKGVSEAERDALVGQIKASAP